jgi:hypothetical protein
MRKFGKLNNIFIPSYVKKNKYINTNSEQAENQTNKTSNDLNTKNQNRIRLFKRIKAISLSKIMLNKMYRKRIILIILIIRNMSIDIMNYQGK